MHNTHRRSLGISVWSVATSCNQDIIILYYPNGHGRTGCLVGGLLTRKKKVNNPKLWDEVLGMKFGQQVSEFLEMGLL